MKCIKFTWLFQERAVWCTLSISQAINQSTFTITQRSSVRVQLCSDQAVALPLQHQSSALSLELSLDGPHWPLVYWKHVNQWLDVHTVLISAIGEHHTEVLKSYQSFGTREMPYFILNLWTNCIYWHMRLFKISLGPGTSQATHSFLIWSRLHTASMSFLLAGRDH